MKRACLLFIGLLLAGGCGPWTVRTHPSTPTTSSVPPTTPPPTGFSPPTLSPVPSSTSTPQGPVGGPAIVLTASLGYAVGALYLKQRLSDVPAVATAAGTMAISALLLVPALPFAFPAHGPGLDTIGSMAALGAGGTGLAFLIFYTMINDVGPARASIWPLGLALTLPTGRQMAPMRRMSC